MVGCLYRVAYQLVALRSSSRVWREGSTIDAPPALLPPRVICSQWPVLRELKAKKAELFLLKYRVHPFGRFIHNPVPCAVKNVKLGILLYYMKKFSSGFYGGAPACRRVLGTPNPHQRGCDPRQHLCQLVAHRDTATSESVLAKVFSMEIDRQGVDGVAPMKHKSAQIFRVDRCGLFFGCFVGGGRKHITSRLEKAC